MCGLLPFFQIGKISDEDLHHDPRYDRYDTHWEHLKTGGTQQLFDAFTAPLVLHVFPKNNSRGWTGEDPYDRSEACYLVRPGAPFVANDICLFWPALPSLYYLIE